MHVGRRQRGGAAVGVIAQQRDLRAATDSPDLRALVHGAHALGERARPEERGQAVEPPEVRARRDAAVGRLFRTRAAVETQPGAGRCGEQGRGDHRVDEVDRGEQRLPDPQLRMEDRVAAPARIAPGPLEEGLRAPQRRHDLAAPLGREPPPGGRLEREQRVAGLFERRLREIEAVEPAGGRLLAQELRQRLVMGRSSGRRGRGARARRTPR